MQSYQRFLRKPRLSLGQQRAQIMAAWPGLEARIDGGALVVRGTVQPSPITLAYRVRVTYADFGVPKAFVMAPLLQRRPPEPGRPIPHTYDSLSPGKERPCLYDPSGEEWTSRRPIAMTILPWLLTWLVDYELWYATGVWFGGGVEHNGPKGGDHPPTGEVAA
jgi:hypothetical protein